VRCADRSHSVSGFSLERAFACDQKTPSHTRTSTHVRAESDERVQRERSETKRIVSWTLSEGRAAERGGSRSARVHVSVTEPCAERFQRRQSAVRCAFVPRR